MSFDVAAVFPVIWLQTMKLLQHLIASLVCGYDVETKMQSSQWVGKRSPRPKKSMDESVKDEGVVGCVF